MTWADRIDELGAFRAEGVRWDTELWPMMARAERQRGNIWLAKQLWTLKFHAWILYVNQQPETCRTCGGRIDGGHKLSRYCTTACRKVAHRRRKGDQSTEWAQRVMQSRTKLAEVRSEMARARRWYKNNHVRGEPPAINPPNLTRIDHLPWLPARCGEGCRSNSVCTITKAACLYAASGVDLGDDDQE